MEKFGKMSKYCAITSIIPSRLIYQNKMYSIISIDNNYVINKYTIYLNKNKIDHISIDADHVNSDPRTDIFCLPNEFYKHSISEKLIENVELLVATYNLENCYFFPWNFITYGPYNHKNYIEKCKKRDKSIMKKIYDTINKIKNWDIDLSGG